MVQIMKERIFWKKQIEQAWEKTPILWLSRVRRASKTYICKSLNNIEHYDCELPGVRRQLESTELFLKSKKGNAWCWMKFIDYLTHLNY